MWVLPTEGPGPVTTTPTGFPIGGNGLFFNNLELRFPLLGPNISGVLFHDMGNIYSSFSDISLRYRQNGNQDFNYAVQAGGLRNPFIKRRWVRCAWIWHIR